MVVPSTKKASDFALQMSLLLKGVPRLKLGESKALPSLKILSVKSVGTFVAKNKSAQAELSRRRSILVTSRKRQEPRRKNFVPDDSFTSIDIMIMDVLAEAHKLAVLAYLGLRKQNKLVWKLPGPSNLFSGSDDDIAECSAFQFLATDGESVYRFGGSFFSTDFKEDAQSKSFQFYFVSEAVETAAQFRDLVNNLSLEQLHSQELLKSFKSNFDQRMKSLEIVVEDLRESHVTMINKQWKQHLDLLRRGDKVKAELSSEITSTRLLLLKRHKNHRLVMPKGEKVATAVADKGKVATAVADKDSSGKRRWF
ncbi:hypothetical protein F511_39046 [Dorcoceras hygrometricum]|uniref:Uncharacterized protein n=1 Tax=Dorcoceras hygrometricum TaxID=472368 RepID=A0A2Z7CFV1_9LAMI|nr:hypothetical protein F511_39046 [Dorcoceras hygrometricum]